MNGVNGNNPENRKNPENPGWILWINRMESRLTEIILKIVKIL
jgi:hypothetical protein